MSIICHSSYNIHWAAVELASLFILFIYLFIYFLVFVCVCFFFLFLAV